MTLIINPNSMEDNKTKQGESTPELNVNQEWKAIQEEAYNVIGSMSIKGASQRLATNFCKTLFEARKSEREKVIGIAIERLTINKAKSSWNENYDFAMDKAIEILTNLKKDA
jgi:hypothetical protein